MSVQVERRQASPSLLAYLVDRVALHDGRPQTYGTQHHWVDGVATPSPIHDPDGVDERRAAAGLPPLAENTAILNDDHDPTPNP